MRSILIILFSVFYLSSTAGVKINMHYCGSKLKKVAFTKISEKGCCGTKEKSKKCCKDKVAAYKIASDQNLKSDSYLNPPTKIQADLTAKQFVFEVDKLNSVPHYSYYIPPLIFEIPLFIKHQSFLI